MAVSSNPKIQKLMDEVDALDDNDKDLEQKLQQIAEAVAAEQQKIRAAVTGVVGKHGSAANGPVDPADEFACEGCQ